MCTFSYYVVVSFGNLLLAEPFKTRYMAFWGKFWTRAVLYCIGFWSIKWVYVYADGSTGSKPPRGQEAFGCYVSNHCSWIDVVVYMSHFFPSFVAKKQVSNLPLVGPISKAMQCLFVDREARLASAEGQGDGGGQGMSQLVKERMLRKHGKQSAELPMLLFPEGTTTNNRYIMPFKRGAFIAGVPVQPIVLRYHTSGRFSPTWDALPGHLHIFLLMTEPAFSVTAHVLPLYTPSEAERADPALYAENVRQAMVRFSGMPAVDETFADKLAFFKYVMERMQLQQQQQQQPGGGGGAHGGEVSGAGEAAGKADGPKAGHEGEAVQKVEVQARAVVQGLRHRKDAAN